MPLQLLTFIRFSIFLPCEEKIRTSAHLASPKINTTSYKKAIMADGFPFGTMAELIREMLLATLPKSPLYTFHI
jgi:hypothetical protein